ncbi:MAG: sodium-dependent transporter [Deltaproteobacteria bacterium]|nr:sodium-dependent transporter [Deltaproteobacteria bacterium]
MNKNQGNFSGQLGFVLAAAGSAVGLGNIWRFPYLAARDGGGLFLLVYLILLLTFGFTLLTADICIGRKTKESSVRAYMAMKPGWGFLGVLTFLVPAIIMTYYTVIGGWILKYMTVYVSGSGLSAAQDGYFGKFITSPVAPLVFMLIFLGLTAYIVYNGVEKGIERSSRLIMPILILVIMGISFFALTLSYTDANGVTRTGMQGLAKYLIPNFDGLTVRGFLQILMDAMSQLFFSLSIAMGIMITYGSYVKDDVDLNRSIGHIEIFDTGVAFLAGLMIIPAIFVYSGMEGMAAGPSLMFVSLPKVFNAMGMTGIIVGFVFFVMAGLAALTSCVSVMEALTADCISFFHTSRKKVTIVLFVLYAVLSTIVCLGYNALYMELPLPNGSKAQILDLMDYISCSFLMPLVALLSSILIGWILTPKWETDEMEKNGEHFGRKKLFIFMIRYVCPLVLLILFLQSTGIC